MEQVRARYGSFYYVLLGFMTIGTLGFGLLIVVWMRTMWVDQVDEQGVTTLSGRRFNWAALTQVQRTAMTAGASRVGGVGGLVFGHKKVLINTMLLSNSAEVLQFVQAKVGCPVMG